MGFYIVFNNFSSFLEESSNALDSPERIQTTVADLVEKVNQDVFAGGQTIVSTESQTDILSRIEDSAENSVLVIDYNEITVADISAHQISPKFGHNDELSEPASEQQNSEIEVEKNTVQNDNYEKYHSLLKKYELSLQYRYDFTDVFKNNRETENFQNSGKLIEKSAKKQRDKQRENSEKRFQEKQAENFRESLKQKLFASQLQNKSK